MKAIQNSTIQQWDTYQGLFKSEILLLALQKSTDINNYESGKDHSCLISWKDWQHRHSQPQMRKSYQYKETATKMVYQARLCERSRKIVQRIFYWEIIRPRLGPLIKLSWRLVCRYTFGISVRGYIMPHCVGPKLLLRTKCFVIPAQEPDV
jgi:hypothetical protein